MAAEDLWDGGSQAALGGGQAVTVAPACSLDGRIHSLVEERGRLLIWVCLSTWHFLPGFYQISGLEDAKLVQITSVCVLLK